MARLIRAVLAFSALCAVSNMAHAAVAVGYIVGFIATYGAAISAVLTVVSVVASVYQASQQKKAARAAMQRKWQEDVANLQSRTLTLITSDAPWTVVYGSPAPIGGAVVNVMTGGPFENLKHIFMIFASHECDAIEELYISGVPVGLSTLDADGYSQNPEFSVPPLYNFGPPTLDGLAVHLHNSPGGVDTYDLWVKNTMNEGIYNGSYRPDHVMSGFTYAIVTVNLLVERFQGGLPDITAKLRGKKVLDIRTGQTVYSRNPALCLADYLRSEQGYGSTAAQIDDNALIAAANVCDEVAYEPSSDLVNYGASRARYTCDGMFRTDQDRDSVRQQLEEAMGGFSLESGGVWRMQAASWSSPVMALTDEDLLGPIKVLQTVTPSAARYNGTRGSYVNAAGIGINEDYTPYQNPTFRTLDESDKFSDMPLSFTGNHVRAHQLARMKVETSRGGFALQINPKMAAWNLQPGDRITLSSGLYAFTNKPFRVTDWGYSQNSPLSLQIVEDSPNYYDLVDEVLADATPNTQLPNPFLKPNVPLDFAVSSGPDLLIQQGSTLVLRARASWAKTLQASVLFGGTARVQWRTTTPVSDWVTSDLSGDSTECYILGLAEHSEYQVRARFQTPYAAGDWAMLTHTAIGKTDLPPDVVGLVAELKADGVWARWSQPGGIDLLDWSTTLIRVGATWESGVEHFNGKALAANLGWLPSGTQRVWAAHFNLIGQSSVPISTTVEILPPLQPAVHGEVWGAQVELSWPDSRTSQPISGYAIKRGATYTSAEAYGSTTARLWVKTEAAGTYRYWVTAVDAAGNTSAPGSAELSPLPSVDEAIAVLQEDLDLQISDLLNVGSGISERLLDEAIARGTAITTLQTLVTEGDEQLAQVINQVSARAVGYVRGNLIRNGGFEFDLDGWTFSTGGWALVEDSWGASARLAAGVPANGWASSPAFPVTAGSIYTGSGDAFFHTGAGTSGFGVEFFNEAGTSLGTTTVLHNGNYDFLNEQVRRNDWSVQALAPATAVTGKVVFVWTGHTTSGDVGIRFCKVEQGSQPPTPYTSEASDRGAVAAIRQEATARASADAAEAVLRETLAVRMNGAEASITTEASVRATQTGALQAKWGINMTVDGKVSGVLLNNDGASSNFTILVDRFAVAQTANGTTKYPFVIGSVAGTPTVGIDGTLVVDGTILARSIQVDQLSAITSRLGYVTAGQVTINGDGVGGWGYIRSPNKWLDSNWGWILAQHPNGSMFVDFTIGNCRLYMYHNPGVSADFSLTGPGFSLTNGGLTINQVDVIDTLSIRGQAVTIPSFNTSAGNSVSMNHFVPGNVALQTFILGIAPCYLQGGYVTITVDGNTTWTGAGVAGTTVSGACSVSLSPGWHSMSVQSTSYAGVSGSSIYALSTRR